MNIKVLKHLILIKKKHNIFLILFINILNIQININNYCYKIINIIIFF